MCVDFSSAAVTLANLSPDSGRECGGQWHGPQYLSIYRFAKLVTLYFTFFILGRNR